MLWNASKKISAANSIDVSQYGSDAKYTPDISYLEKHEYQNVFFSDDLMRGGRHHDLVASASKTGEKPLWCGYTFHPFHHYIKNLGKFSFPVMLKDPIPNFTRWPAEKLKVWGEIYSVRPYRFKELDTLRENGVQFERQRIIVQIPDFKIRSGGHSPLPRPDKIDRVTTIAVWAYVGIQKYWDDQLGGSFDTPPVSPVDDTRPWLGRYSQYSP